MPILHAEIQVGGRRAPFAVGSFSFWQITDYEGRPSTDVRLGLIELLLVGEEAAWVFWEEWMLDAHRRQSGQLVFFQGEGQTAKTVVFYDAFCVHYECRFDARGQDGRGSLVTEIHLSAAAEEVQGQFSEAHSVIPWATDEVTRRRALTKPTELRPSVALQPQFSKDATPKKILAETSSLVQKAGDEGKQIGLKESIEEIRHKYGEKGVELVEKTEARAKQILEHQSNAERGPVLSGVMDTVTGVIYYGQNTVSPPSNLHPLLKSRLEEYERKTGGQTPVNLGVPGAHSEIYALDQALKAREKDINKPLAEADLSSFLLHNRSLRGKTKGVGVPPRCTNCAVLTDGITVIGNN